MTVKILGRFQKQPAEVLDYDVDYSRWFAGRTVTPASYTVDVQSGLTKVADSISGNVVKVVLGGGTVGTSYKVTVRLTTTGTVPLVKEADFTVFIKEA